MKRKSGLPARARSRSWSVWMSSKRGKSITSCCSPATLSTFPKSFFKYGPGIFIRIRGEPARTNGQPPALLAYRLGTALAGDYRLLHHSHPDSDLFISSGPDLPGQLSYPDRSGE